MHIAHNCDSVSFKANGKATKQVVCRYTWCVLLVFLSNPLKSFNLCKRPQNASSSYHSFLFTNTMHLSQPFFISLFLFYNSLYVSLLDLSSLCNSFSFAPNIGKGKCPICTIQFFFKTFSLSLLFRLLFLLAQCLSFYYFLSSQKLFFILFSPSLILYFSGYSSPSDDWNLTIPLRIFFPNLHTVFFLSCQSPAFLSLSPSLFNINLIFYFII